LSLKKFLLMSSLKQLMSWLLMTSRHRLPKWHHENAAELAALAPTTLAELFTVADQIAKERGLDGYRLAFNTGESAGQTVFHAHLHLLGGRPFGWPPG
jgi:histidine triad (HIT) family protein